MTDKLTAHSGRTLAARRPLCNVPYLCAPGGARSRSRSKPSGRDGRPDTARPGVVTRARRQPAGIKAGGRLAGPAERVCRWVAADSLVPVGPEQLVPDDHAAPVVADER